MNPDFSQVEADASQFTYDPRSALFFPEKRPFFLEGIEQFTTPNNLIYTRRVVAPLVRGQADGKGRGHARGRPRRRGRRGGLGAAAATIPSSTSCACSATWARTRASASSTPTASTAPTSNRVAEVDAHLAFASLYALDVQGGAEPHARKRRDDGAPVAGRARAQRPPLRLPPRPHRPPSRLPRGQRLHQPRRHRAREPGSSRDVLRSARGILGERLLRRRAGRDLALSRLRARSGPREEAAPQQQRDPARRMEGGRFRPVETLRASTPSSTRTTRWPGPRRPGPRSCPSRARPPSTTSTTSSSLSTPEFSTSRAASSTSGAATRTSSNGRPRTSSTSPSSRTGARPTRSG